ncbi:MAG: hypothetical protein K0A90_00270 [Methanosarcinaceae archaeon]|nr:hypothetical protein [Methanosarcinaceae archaeon]
MGYKYINKIGIEIEGGWIHSFILKYLKGDGSVHINNMRCYDDDDDEDEDYNEPYGYSGEVCSEPINIQEGIEYINNYYPDEFNETCGIHFHISFKNNKYASILTDKRFYEMFIKDFTVWGLKQKIDSSSLFWTRLNGKNQFCKNIFNPDGQILQNDSRYTQINFCSLKKHNTVEFRVFPVFDKKHQTVSALKKLVSIINKFIDKCNKEYSEKITINI